MTEITIDDPTFQQKELGPIDRFLMKFIRDERDLPFLHLGFKLSLISWPAAVFLFWPGMFEWYWGALYFTLNLGIYMPPYILMLHNTSHRKLFKQEYEIFNQYIPRVLGLFYGQTPDTYFTHHLGMHHNEGNLPKDRSSTMNNQRDSLFHFLRYWFRFFIIGIFDLSRYFAQNGPKKLFRRTLAGEFSYYVIIGTGLYFNWQATVCVFLVPFFVARFGMMAGNWGQHAFVDHEKYDDDYLNSITCINAVYNKRCFNDGYHIGHHVKANRHWTEMPEDFLNNLDTYRDKKAIVFEKLDFFIVWFYLMTKNYKKLARHMVVLRDDLETEESRIALIKERVRRFSKEELQAI